jgi:hypothetical protein
VTRNIFNVDATYLKDALTAVVRSARTSRPFG